MRIREIQPADEDRLKAAHGRLSAEAQYRRFLTPKPALSSADARYLVNVDGWRHFALVATLADDPDTIVAVARFVRLPEEPEAAEFAIVVGDSYQRQGLGSELLAELIEAALDRGVERFVATVLTHNRAAMRLIRRFSGGTLSERRLGLTTEIEFGLAGPRVAMAITAPAMIAACPGS